MPASTWTRVEQNRANAAHSTGPRTEEGKSRSKLNALNHGLASNAVVLPYESTEKYEQLKTSFIEKHQPGSDLETIYVGQMVDCWWRLQRAYRVEAQFLKQREAALAAAGEATEDDALARLFSDPKEMARMRLFMRYLGAAERAWARACSDFEKAKKERLKAEAELHVTGFVPNPQPHKSLGPPALRTVAAPQAAPEQLHRSGNSLGRHPDPRLA